MKPTGQARRAAFKLLLMSLLAVGVILAVGVLATIVGTFVRALSGALVMLWVLFALFTLYFFRDPNPLVLSGANLVVSPAHGTVDVIDTTASPDFMGGECQRLSIFLSVFNVHVQNAPVSGKITALKYTPGEFLNALKTESAAHNENVLLAFEASEPRGQIVGVRLIAGLLARRIVPFVQQGDTVTRGERIGLIQFGSRVDLYLPRSAEVKVKLGDKVVGGETVVAEWGRNGVVE